MKDHILKDYPYSNDIIGSNYIALYSSTLKNELYVMKNNGNVALNATNCQIL